MSLTVSDSPTLSLTHSFTAPSLHCDTTLRDIRSCVTELLSDIRPVQMDDLSVWPWPTDKKPFFPPLSLFSHVFLTFTSLKAQLQSFVTPWRKKFPANPRRDTSYSLFRALPKEQEALWCRHISCVPLLGLLSLFLNNTVLPQAHRDEREMVSCGWCVYLCVKAKTNGKNVFFYIPPL